jgi:putative FmdB family regulatory protein
MPLYDYDCAACGRRFETIHGLFDDAPAVCPLCGSGPVRKAIGAPAVHYKGSGWAKKERRVKPASTGSSAADGGEGTSDSPSGDDTSTTKDAKTPTPKTGSSGSSGSSGSTGPTAPSSTANPD